VDDQVAIIGSANINERSMLGNRDSEVAAIVRDREMIWSRMGNKRVRVGRFPHTLRMRLMHEHLGIDVDIIQERERLTEEYERVLRRMSEDGGSRDGQGSGSDGEDQIDGRKARDFLKARHSAQDEYLARAENVHSFNHDYDVEGEEPHMKTKIGKPKDPRVMGNTEHRLDVEGKGFDHMEEAQKLHEDVGRDTTVDRLGREILVNSVANEGHGSLSVPRKHHSGTRARSISAPQPHHESKERGNLSLPPSRVTRMDTQALGLTLLSQLPALPASDDTDIGGPPLQRSFSHNSMSIIAPLVSAMH